MKEFFWPKEFGPGAERKFLIRWLGISLFFHLLTAWFSQGYHSADEQFQILEFLSYKLGGAPRGVLAVEFGERMRPWLPIALDFGIVRGWQALGIDSPFVWVRSIRVLNGVLGWASIVALVHCGPLWFSDRVYRRWAVIALCSLWYLPLLHARPSSEGLAGTFFALGITAVAQALKRSPREPWLWLAAGLAWGVSFESRFQMGLMIAGVGALALAQFRTHWRGLLVLFLGFLVVFALGRGADRWGFGDWSFSPWNYFSYNLIRGEVSRYGHEPFWDPILRMPATESWPVLGLVATWLTILGWFRNRWHLLTWAHVPFFLVHELIAHKEFRFFFPIALSAPPIMVLGLQNLRLPKKPLVVLGSILFALNTLALVAHSLVPLARTAQFYELVWNHLPDPRAETILYAGPRDPYEVLGTPIYFYRPPGLQIRRFSAPDEISATAPAEYWLFWPKLRLPEDVARLLPSCVKTAQTLPDGIERINWNGWADRANAWSLWKCRR